MMKERTVKFAWIAVLYLISFQAQSRMPEKFETLDCGKSSTIEFAYFYPESNVVRVAFKDRRGIVYTYRDFPRNLWEGWKTAKSKGKYFNQNIRGKVLKKSPDWRISS